MCMLAPVGKRKLLQRREISMKSHRKYKEKKCKEKAQLLQLVQTAQKENQDLAVGRIHSTLDEICVA
jgi:hypothetical protein